MNLPMITPDAGAVDLSKLMAWYSSHCDGIWEHEYGISIRTLDNPGWLLEVNLVGTNLQREDMLVLSENCDNSAFPEKTPWIDCRIRDNRFVGAADQSQLPRLISLFNALLDSAEGIGSSES